jgi:phenylacetic acid degradation operon negative regulatory protein
MSLVEREHKGAMNIALEHPLPQWMVDRLVDQDVQVGAKKLQQRLQTVAQISDLSDLDRVVLRLSIVHEWRRIILRIPDVPDQVLANGIPIKELRQGVQQLLASVSDVTLDYIDRASKS